MDWKKWILSGAKYFGVALAGVIVAALTTMTTAYVPEGLLQEFLWKFIALPVVVGIIGLIQNYLKHKND